MEIPQVQLVKQKQGGSQMDTAELTSNARSGLPGTSKSTVTASASRPKATYVFTASQDAFGPCQAPRKQTYNSPRLQEPKALNCVLKPSQDERGSGLSGTRIGTARGEAHVALRDACISHVSQPRDFSHFIRTVCLLRNVSARHISFETACIVRQNARSEFTKGLAGMLNPGRTPTTCWETSARGDTYCPPSPCKFRDMTPCVHAFLFDANACPREHKSLLQHEQGD